MSSCEEKFGNNFIVGVSCSNSFNLYKKAKKEGADYIAFGPSFKTTTKNKEAIDLDSIKIFFKENKLPFILIGESIIKISKIYLNLNRITLQLSIVYGILNTDL